MRRAACCVSSGLPFGRESGPSQGCRARAVSPSTRERFDLHSQPWEGLTCQGHHFGDPSCPDTSMPAQPLVVETDRNRFRRIARGLVFESFRCHDFRHTSATLALQEGIVVKVVSERLGHARVAFTLDTCARPARSATRGCGPDGLGPASSGSTRGVGLSAITWVHEAQRQRLSRVVCGTTNRRGQDLPPDDRGRAPEFAGDPFGRKRTAQLQGGRRPRPRRRQRPPRVGG